MVTRSLVWGGLAAGAVTLVLAWPPTTSVVSQESTASAPEATALTQGERYESDAWSLAVQGSFSTPSPTRHGYTEVRVDVALQNRSPSELIYRSTALAGDPGYPALVLRDSSGTVRRLDLARLSHSTVPGSALVAQPPAVPGRWTLGYQVPTAYASNLELVAVWQGAEVAHWNLTPGSQTSSYPGWQAAAEAVPARWGQDIPWAPDLVVTPLGHDLEVCATSETRPAPVVYGLALQIHNTGVDDVSWTGVHYPDEAAIAIWPDGGSARNGGTRVAETFVTQAGGARTDPLEGLGPELRVLSPQVTTLRMLGFPITKDSRFASALAYPQSVALYPPDGSVVWLDTSGDQLIDFTVPSEACDDMALSPPFDVVPAS